MTIVTLGDRARTASAAAVLLPLIAPGDLIQLHGHLGAGKTTLVQALALAAGVTEQVRSPTFTVAHRHSLPDGSTFAHLDLYRSQGGLGTEAWADIEPYFEARYVCVEWPGPLQGLLGDRPIWTLMLGWPDHAPDTMRVLRVDAPRASAQRQCTDALAHLLR